jgi:hypothetical protein
MGVLSTQESGEMISEKGQVLKHNQTELSMKGSGHPTCEVGRAFYIIRTAVSMTANGLTISVMGWVFTTTKVIFIRGSGCMGVRKEMGLRLGLAGKFIRGSSKMGRDMVMGSSIYKMMKTTKVHFPQD